MDSVGQCLAHVAKERNTLGLIFPPEDQANILDPAKLRALFEQHQPSYAIVYHIQALIHH